MAHSVLTEWKATDPSAATFAGTSREVLRFPFSGRAHTVQQVSFNPTAAPGDADYGNLYVLVGGGGDGVGNFNPQDPSTAQGTIMRINPLGTNGSNGKYGVPADNPFLTTPGALPEIYAIGMRDPHRISWDPEGENAMYLGHIGEWQVESIYKVEPGDNFGWSVREGPFRAQNRQIFPLPANDAGFTYPVPPTTISATLVRSVTPVSPSTVVSSTAVRSRHYRGVTSSPISCVAGCSRPTLQT